MHLKFFQNLFFSSPFCSMYGEYTLRNIYLSRSQFYSHQVCLIYTFRGFALPWCPSPDLTAPTFPNQIFPPSLPSFHSFPKHLFCLLHTFFPSLPSDQLTNLPPPWGKWGADSTWRQLQIITLRETLEFIIDKKINKQNEEIKGNIKKKKKKIIHSPRYFSTENWHFMYKKHEKY